MRTRILLVFLLPLTAFASQPFPGKAPGNAVSSTENDTYLLKNDLISATWSAKGGHLRPAEIVDRLHGRTLPQASREMFRFSTEVDAGGDQTWLGFELGNEWIEVRSSTNGRGWRTISRIPRAGFEGEPALVRIGKMDKSGGLSDYPDAGAVGNPLFDNFRANNLEKVLVEDNFEALSTAWTPRVSDAPGSAITINEGSLKVTAPANSAAFLERKFPAGTTALVCQIDHADDQGLSWGPGIALIWKNGESIVANIRKDGAGSVISKGEEEVVGNPFQTVPSYNIVASDLKITEGPKLIDLAVDKSSPRAGSHHPGKAIVAKLRDEKTGLAVMWRAVLRDGSNYIREEITLASSSAPLTLTGIQMLDRTASAAAISGTVPGSPVIAGNLFFGAEIPVYSTEIGGDGFTSGFPCNYPLEAKQRVHFSSVMGVLPDGQLRRGFQYYLERERARPAKAYLHYNGWYDAAVSEKRFLEVIAAYKSELIEKRGVTLDGFVIDDGWDDPQSTFWGWKTSVLPTGLDKLGAAAKAAKSHLGIWISPLGGYGEAPQRIANARKQGLTDNDTLDLSKPKYYQWFKEKCLTLMHEDGINYFKWDKAGDGVNPHFMSLLKLADELHEDAPNLFINVTVGTWPSPFWLNHVDCTWHGGGDVAWIGKGDKREQWLTYRDQSAHSVVKRGPLYPLNSLMLHGLVLGHAYQGKTVAEAGNHLVNECRSFFGSGTCMQEIYLSPDLMDDAAWDALAESAKWSKKFAAVLIDTHMIGGEPAKLEPYGWAAWMPGMATLTLRNPDDKPRTITLDAQSVFELPDGAPREFSLKTGYPDQRVKSLDLSAGKAVTVELQPFEVLVFDNKS